MLGICFWGEGRWKSRWPDRRAGKKGLFWKKDQWEMYDLAKDPAELHNIYQDPAQADTVAKLKQELLRLKKELKDDDQFADQQPDTGVDPPAPRRVGAPPTKAMGRERRE